MLREKEVSRHEVQPKKIFEAISMFKSKQGLKPSFKTMRRMLQSEIQNSNLSPYTLNITGKSTEKCICLKARFKVLLKMALFSKMTIDSFLNARHT